MKSTHIFFIWIILFSLLFVSLFIPLHLPFSGDNSVVPYLIIGNTEDLSQFNSQEISHMQDVRVLILIAFTLFSILTAIFSANPIIDKKILMKKLLYFDIIVILCLIFFNSFFKLFHLILFPQGNWTFPYNSLLIQTYPLGFFVWMFVFWIIIINLMILIITKVSK